MLLPLSPSLTSNKNVTGIPTVFLCCSQNLFFLSKTNFPWIHSNSVLRSKCSQSWSTNKNKMACSCKGLSLGRGQELDGRRSEWKTAGVCFMWHFLVLPLGLQFNSAAKEQLFTSWWIKTYIKLPAANTLWGIINLNVIEMLYTQSLAHKSFQSLSREKQSSWLLALSTAMKSPCLNSRKTLLPTSRKDFPPQK